MRSNLLPAVGVLVSTVLAGTAGAQTAAQDAARFGSREDVLHLSIAPDGSKIAVVSPAPEGGENIIVTSLDGKSKDAIIRGSRGGSERIARCDWLTPDRLSCQMMLIMKRPTGLVSYTRLMAVNANGSDPRIVEPTVNLNEIGEAYFGGDLVDFTAPDGGNTVLMTHVFVPSAQTGRYTASRVQGLGVISIDTMKRTYKIVEQPKITAESFISDGYGHVRVMGLRSANHSGYSVKRAAYQFRMADSREWLPLSETHDEAAGILGFVPLAVDPKLDVVYGLENKTGYAALYKRRLVPGAQSELVLGSDKVDIDGPVRIGRHQRVVGVSYATETRKVEFFDPQLAKLRENLGKVFPTGTQIGFVDSTEDEGKLVLLATSDINPGTYYLYDKATHQMGELLPIRPQLAGMKMAVMKPVTYPAGDGTQIPAYLTLPPGAAEANGGKGLPAIVMPHGGPSARDEWGFDWLVEFFAHRGFAVLQPNYRGSAGFGTKWSNGNAFRSWQTAIGDVNDAGRWLIAQGITTPDKLGIFGWSYGGYAALQAQVLDPDLFKAVVAVAPVTDLDMLRAEFRDFADYRLVENELGGANISAAASPAQNAQRFKAPVLMFHGTLDQNVSVAESRLMLGKLQGAHKQAELIEFPDLDHQLFSNAARTRLLATSEAFLRKAFGMPEAK